MSLNIIIMNSLEEFQGRKVMKHKKLYKYNHHCYAFIRKSPHHFIKIFIKNAPEVIFENLPNTFEGEHTQSVLANVIFFNILRTAESFRVLQGARRGVANLTFGMLDLTDVALFETVWQCECSRFLQCLASSQTALKHMHGKTLPFLSPSGYCGGSFLEWFVCSC